MNRIEEDTRAFLLAQVSAASGRVFIGGVKDPSSFIPNKAVFLMQHGGVAPHGYMDGGGTDYRRVRVQVRVRSETDDYSGGKTLAESLLAALQRAHFGSPGYVRVTVDSSAPLYWGRDEKEHHEWSVNATIEVED